MTDDHNPQGISHEDLLDYASDPNYLGGGRVAVGAESKKARAKGRS